MPTDTQRSRKGPFDKKHQSLKLTYKTDMPTDPQRSSTDMPTDTQRSRKGPFDVFSDLCVSVGILIRKDH